MYHNRAAYNPYNHYILPTPTPPIPSAQRKRRLANHHRGELPSTAVDGGGSNIDELARIGYKLCMAVYRISLLAAVDPRVLIWLAVVLGVMLAVSIIIVVVAKRRCSRRETTGPDGPAFTLEQLKKLHQDGKVSEQEFHVLRNKLLRETRNE